MQLDLAVLRLLSPHFCGPEGTTDDRTTTMATKKKTTEEVVDLQSSVEAFLGRLDDKWQDHPLAWAMRQLAMDISMCPPQSTAGAVKELRTTMAELRALAPEVKTDGVDEVAAARAERRRRAGLPA